MRTMKMSPQMMVHIHPLGVVSLPAHGHFMRHMVEVLMVEICLLVHACRKAAEVRYQPVPSPSIPPLDRPLQIQVKYSPKTIYLT